MNRDSNMIAHCRREIPEWFAEPDGPNRWIADGTVELLAVLGHQGHSGSSIGYALDFFTKMAKFEPWGPLLGTDEEWSPIDYGGMGTDNDMKFQNIRCSRVFKRADGTAYDIYGKVFREPDGACFTSQNSHVDVEFPYTPTTEYIDVNKSKGAFS